jgi:predicted metalloprotease
MLWENGRRSENIEDRRGIRMPGGILGGGVGVVVIALIAMFFGVDPRVILQEAGQIQAPSGQQQVVPIDPAQDKLKDFVSVVLADTEDTWGDIFQRAGAHYEMPRLVLFSGAVRSACGLAQSAVGPFYCAGDQKVYIDLDFYKMLESRFGAPGEFAKAYVVAHEIGHHVQNAPASPAKCVRR